MDEKSLPARIVDAIRSDDVSQIRALFSAHPEQLTWHTPFSGQTWLGYAASEGKLGTVRVLVEMGGDINQGDHRENIKPICAAAACGEADVVSYLLTLGAVLDTETSVQNPLFAAIVGKSKRITQLLLEAGIDSNARYNSKTMQDMDAVAFGLMRGETECAKTIAAWQAQGDEKAVSHILQRAYELAEKNAYGKEV